MDYPGKLYFFIFDIISKFGHHAGLIWMIAGLCLILLLVSLSLSHFYISPLNQNKNFIFYRSNWFFLTLASFLIIFERLPLLLSCSMNPDEDLWMAGAATIMDDPRFWISFDPTTSGPLVVLPLVLIKMLGSNINYASVRMAALLFCMIPSLVLLFFSFKNLFNEKISRIIMLPLIVCMAFFHLKNYIVYNSEHVPILLTSLGIFIYSKIDRSGPVASSYYLYLFLGLTLGCFPYAKLQAVPLGLGMGCFFLYKLLNDFSPNRKETLKKLFFFLSGGFLPSLIVLFYLTISSAGKDFWSSYIVSNLNYANYGVNGQIHLWMKFKYLIYLLRSIPDSSLYFISLFFSSITVLGVLLILKRKELWTNKKILIFAFLMIITSYYGIVKPSTFYEHYLLLFFVPALFFSGALLGIFEKVFNNSKLMIVFLHFFIFITVVVPCFYSLTNVYFANDIYIRSDGFKRHKAADLILKYAEPGDKMAIWGWMTDLYVQTGLTLGTRYGDSYHQITESKLQSYYINNYVFDLKRTKPKIFVDVITPDAYFFNELRNRHESYSMIDSYIKENYKMLGEVDQIRIYIRN
jgi:hypothetical protein